MMKIELTENGYIIKFVRIKKNGKIGIITNSKISKDDSKIYFIKIFESDYCDWYKETDLEIYMPIMQDILYAHLHEKGKEIIEKANNVLINSKCTAQSIDNIGLNKNDIAEIVEDIYSQSLFFLEDAIVSSIEKVEKYILGKYIYKINELAQCKVKNDVMFLLESYGYKKN